MSAPSISILVVEDNAATRKMARLALDAEGYRVLEAEDARTCMAILETEIPDLILQDLTLPDADGLDLVQRIRARPGLEAVPILAFSGFLARLDEARATKVGFTDFLLKPVEPSRLARVVRSYLPLPGSPAEQPGANKTLLLVDDEPMARKLNETRLRLLGFNVHCAEDGEQALRLARLATPDAIVSDVVMPGLDGFSLCQAVRQDPALAAIPVILTSGYLAEPADQEIAGLVGANALVPLSAGLGEVVAAVSEAIAGRLPAPSSRLADASAAGLYVRRLAGQLKRQARAASALDRARTLQRAEILVLGALSENLAASEDPNEMLQTVLENCLQAAGVSQAALLLGNDGRLFMVSASLGLSPESLAGLPGFFGYSSWLAGVVAQGEPVTLSSPLVDEEVARAVSAGLDTGQTLIAPVRAGGRPLGALILADRSRDFLGEDWLAFGAVVAAQVGQAVALARSFTRLAETEREYRALFENAIVGIYRMSPEGTVLSVNPALAGMAGYASPEDAVADQAGLRVYLMADAEPAAFLSYVERSEGSFIEFESRRSDGQACFVSQSARSVRDAAGRIVRAEGFVRDVTDDKRNESALRQSEKLSAMGALLAGVAHELNNPLSVILGQAELLNRHLGDGPESRRVQQIVEAAARSSRIVGNFLALARQRPLEKQATRLDSVVRETVEIVAYPMRVDNVEVVLDLEPNLPQLMADPHQLGQVLVNLLTNAHDALRQIDGERRIRIATRYLPARGALLLDVSDTGPGMTAEARTRAFEPFFTTKPPGRGTGLGLSLCKGIVESHGGTIAVESEQGRGSTFTIELPLPAVVEAPPPAPVGVAAVAPGRILLVDDEPALLDLLAEVIGEDGHAVDRATNGRGALQALTTTDYDLVMTDVKMPDLDGPGLYRQALRLRPSLGGRFVFMTGDTLSPETQQFLEETRAPMLAKPASADEVVTTVRRALRSRRTEPTKA